MQEPDQMSAPPRQTIYRFGVFEADAATGELRRQGMRVRINIQPFQVLLMLLDRPGELVTREEIARELWSDGTFVDVDHGVNSAVNRIREALDDSARNPRFIETLARRGYRFVAPVMSTETNNEAGAAATVAPAIAIPAESGEAPRLSRILASPEDLPATSHHTVRVLFLLLQAMYLAFYIGALANLPEIEQLISFLSYPTVIFTVLIVTAAILLPVRIFIACATLFRAPRLTGRLLRLWPFLLPFDILWSLSPFLLLHHISFGVALACVAPLVYSPFAQRALILMGAAANRETA